MKEFVAVRPEVQQFAQMMERALRKHDDEKGKAVAGINRDYCIRRLNAEYEELAKVWNQMARCEKPDTKLLQRLNDEAVDVANFCMMLCL